MSRVVYETENKVWRIREVLDMVTTFDDLCGDSFKPECNPDIDADDLARDLAKFKQRWLYEGTFGYILERWNPEPSVGYEHVDSCYGFVGEYSEGAESYDHYVINEFKQTIAKGTI